ncbi:MAG: GNAT family N-acetyltransferase [Candidatus Promineifilaceae bacterium]|nr:GNAT family N-acetyltransferase [Candidatus Promineifilaceae bacterium]
MVRPYETADAQALSLIHNSVFPDDIFSPSGFDDYIDQLRALGAAAWVIEELTIAGYALIVPVPGLTGITELTGCIAPDQQRQGLGGSLLSGLITELRETGTRQITYHVQSLDVPAAQFLLHNDFFVEHEEWLMVREAQPIRMDMRSKNKFATKTYPRGTAVPLFRHIYKQSFSGLPWDQPFAEDEVSDLLDSAEDLLFLTHEAETVGVAWIRANVDGTGVIEPLAIIPAFQNRGLGRALLTSAINVLARRNVKRIEIGAWRDNKRAIHLYQSLGFRRHKTITYLAYNLP